MWCICQVDAAFWAVPYSLSARLLVPSSSYINSRTSTEEISSLKAIKILVTSECDPLTTSISITRVPVDNPDSQAPLQTLNQSFCRRGPAVCFNNFSKWFLHELKSEKSWSKCLREKRYIRFWRIALGFPVCFVQNVPAGIIHSPLPRGHC